jgi:hypothetical protein
MLPLSSAVQYSANLSQEEVLEVIAYAQLATIADLRDAGQHPGTATMQSVIGSIDELERRKAPSGR